MKPSQSKTFSRLIVIAGALALAACGTSKSNENTGASNNNTNVSIGTQKAVASCHKSADSNISMNISAVVDSSGYADPNTLKVKFNFLSTAATASGNYIQFFKWRVTGTQAYLDPAPVTFSKFALSSPAAQGSTAQLITANTVTKTDGYLLNINDPNGSFQVLKAVVYSSTGTVVAQMNILIPQFYALYSDYLYNSDGTSRASLLTDLHPLKSLNYNATESVTYFQSLCF